MGLGLSKLIFFRFVWGATCLELKSKRPSDNGEEEKKNRHQEFVHRSPKASSMVRHNVMSRDRLNRCF